MGTITANLKFYSFVMIKPSPGTKFYGTKMLLKLTYSKVEFQNFAGGNTPGPLAGGGAPLPNPPPAPPSAVRDGFAVDKSYAPLPKNPGYATGSLCHTDRLIN